MNVNGKKERKASSIYRLQMEYWISSVLFVRHNLYFSHFEFVLVKCCPIKNVSIHWNCGTTVQKLWKNYNNHKCLVYDFKRLLKLLEANEMIYYSRLRQCKCSSMEMQMTFIHWNSIFVLNNILGRTHWLIIRENYLLLCHTHKFGRRYSNLY